MFLCPKSGTSAPACPAVRSPVPVPVPGAVVTSSPFCRNPAGFGSAAIRGALLPPAGRRRATSLRGCDVIARRWDGRESRERPRTAPNLGERGEAALSPLG